MVINRIIQYLDKKGITNYRFCKDIGVSNAFLSRERSIGTDKCEIILKTYTDLNPTWLLTGKGEMILKDIVPVDQRIQSILDLNKEDQERILITIDALVRDSKNKKSKN